MVRRFASTVTAPFERGEEFGRAHPAELGATVNAYSRLFGAFGPVDLDGWGERALARIDAWAPESGEEIRGMAAGSGVPVRHIAALNARTEILGLLRAATQAVPPWAPECSTVVVLGGSSPFAVQNWDWYAAMADNWLEWTVTHADGRRVTTLTEYGIVGKIGCNDRGIAVLLNMLRHREDGDDLGVPVHVVARRILDTASDVPAALALCGSAAVSASTSLTIASRHTAVSVELWPSGPGHVLPDEDGLLLRTNHFLTAAGQAGDVGPTNESDTLERYRWLRERLGGRGRELTAEKVVEILASHDGLTCCHPDPNTAPELQTATLATVRVNLAEATLTITAGNPCTATPT